MTYKVLWFDDKFHDQELRLERANLQGITLVGFTNAEEGIAELQRNLNEYDAVLLDGLFYENPDQQGEPTKTKAISKVLRTLDELSRTRKIPKFILSGQQSFTNQPNETVENYEAKVYNKGNAEDEVLLWEDIKLAASQQTITQIRLSHSRVFEACKSFKKSDEIERLLTKALLDAKTYPEFCDDSRNDFTGLRKIIELLFEELSSYDIIPITIFKGQGWINGCGKFLSGEIREVKNIKYEIIGGLIPRAVGFMLKQILEIFQDGSHIVEEKLSQAFDQFVASNQTSYLFKSSLYLLLDVIVWLDTFMKSLKSGGLQPPFWTECENNWLEGEIVRILPNGSGKFQTLKGNTMINVPQFLMQQHKLIQGQKIEITTKPGKEPDKLHIGQIRKQ